MNTSLRNMVYGLHSVEELLRTRAHQIQELLVQQADATVQQKGIAKIVELAETLGLQATLKSRHALDQLTEHGNHQGAVAVCHEYAYTELKDLLGQLKAPAFLLVLDGVTDPQNLGALIRSAYLLGAQGLVIPQDRSSPVTATVLKAASGAAEYLPIARVKNLVRALEELREAGIWLYAAALDAKAKQPWQMNFTLPVALVLGSEGTGVRPLVKKTCDETVAIPMAGQLQGASLNVSASGAVLLYEAHRQRMMKR